MTKYEFLKKAREIHGYKYLYPDLPDKITYKDKISIIHNNVLYTQSIPKHLIGRCPEKNTSSKTTEQFIEEARKVWGDKYDYSLVIYEGALRKVKIIYEGVIFEQIASQHLNGRSPEKNLNIENFIRKSKLKHGDKYDYSKVKFIDGNTPVLIGYNGIYYLQKPYHHLSGNCPEKLNLAIRKTTRQFIKESNLVHDFKYNYDKTDYVSNQTKVIITCMLHGDFDQRPLSHINGNGCPSCSESKGEKEIARILDENGINYDRQKKFQDCRNKLPLPFDFYIPSIRTCIEFDGLQHFQPVEHFGGVETYNILKQNDKIKSDYCEENFINLIRMKYDDDIHQMLHENLKNTIKLKSNSPYKHHQHY